MEQEVLTQSFDFVNSNLVSTRNVTHHSPLQDHGMVVTILGPKSPLALSHKGCLGVRVM